MDTLRPEVYKVLALGFQRPTAESVGYLSDARTRRLLADATEAMFLPPRVEWNLLDEFRAGVTARGPDAIAAELRREYCRLFLIPGAPCLPYGSLYLDHVVMGPSTLDVVHRYREEGLRLGEVWREPPDHIAVELSFMAVLSARLDQDGRTGETTRAMRAQAGFLRTHLARWGPLFAQRVARSTPSNLYRLVAGLLPHWLVADEELVRASLAEIRQEAG